MASTNSLRMAGKPFSVAATDYLVNNAGVIPASQIASRLGRTTKAIRRKAEKLGLSLAVN